MRDRWAIAAFTTGLVTFCAVSLVTGHHVAVAVTATASSFGVVAIIAGARATQHARLVRTLRRRSVPRQLAGIAVRTGDLGDAAFAAGLRRPTIFCDARLPEQLTPAQLRAVLLHERAHQRSFDPARLLLVAVVTPLFRRVPTGRQWLATTLARREIAADDRAIADGAARSDLAAALLKLPRSPTPAWPDSHLPPSSASAPCWARTRARPRLPSSDASGTYWRVASPARSCVRGSSAVS